MKHSDIIDMIINHKPYMRYCNKLTNYSDIAKDLYQEFFIFIFNKSEDELLKIYNTGGLHNYCYCVIFNKSRHVDKFFKSNGEDNPLLRIANRKCFDGNYFDVEQNDVYNEKIDNDFDKVIDYVTSDLSIKQEDWLIFTESIDAKLKDLSKETKIPYITLKIKRKRIKDKIKKNVSI